MDAFKNYSWPGNIRELENYIERSVILSSGSVLSPPMNELEQPLRPPPSTGEPSRSATLEECERNHILRALSETRWLVGGRSGAAARLGVKRSSEVGEFVKMATHAH